MLLSISGTKDCSASLQEAKESSNFLQSRVNRLLENNQEMALRLSRLELPTNKTMNSADAKPSLGVHSCRNPNIVYDELQNELSAGEFLSDIHSSRAYARSAQKISCLSHPRSTSRSLRWSFLSKMSMSDVSNISVISILVATDDVSKREHYMPIDGQKDKSVSCDYFDSTMGIDLGTTQDANISELQFDPIAHPENNERPIHEAEEESLILPSVSPSPTQNFESFRHQIAYDDPCYVVLPAALIKNEVDTDWRRYALYIVFGDGDGDEARCLGMYNQPLRIFQSYDRRGRKPMFMLRRHNTPVFGFTTFGELGSLKKIGSGYPEELVNIVYPFATKIA